MSFQEKSLWLVFLSVTAFSAFYFAQALPGAGRDVMPGQVALFVAAIVALSAGLVTEGNFVFTHVLFGSWVLAQLVETGSQLWMHRRGA